MASSKDENVTLYPRGAEVSTGSTDAHDGIKLGLDGEPFWRVHITPQGQILTGNGFQPGSPYNPANVFIQPAPPVTELDQYMWIETSADEGDVVTFWIET